MILLTLLITVLLEYYFNFGAVMRRWQWFERYCQYIESTLLRYFPHPTEIATIVAILAPVVLIVGLLQSLLNTPLWGLLDLLFGVVVLLMTVEAKPLIQAYMKSASNKNQLTEALADNPGHLTFAQFLRAEKGRVLCPVLWYIVLGPMGAVLYRMSAELIQLDANSEHRQKLVQRWLDWLEWLPVRLTVISFAVVDNFLPCFKYWVTALSYGPNRNDDVLIDGATHASSIKAQAAVLDKPESIGLIAHSLIFWLVLVAILTVTAWVN